MATESSIDIDAITAPLSGGPPCGSDLEYDPAFTELEVLARGKPEREIGGTRIEAEEPDWKDIEQRCVALFSRTRDLRVAVLLTRALTRNFGPAGLAQGLAVARGLVDRLWDDLHPALDPDDETPSIMRVNALRALVDEGGLLRDVRASEFARMPGFGRVTVRDALLALNPPDGADEPRELSREQIEGIARDALARDPRNFAAEAIRQARELAQTFAARDASGASIDVDALVSLLEPLARLGASSSGPSEDGPAAEEDAQRPSGSGTAASPAGPAEIRTRDDVIRLLDRACEFLQRTEPSNPAPLLIRRAQRLMTMDFMAIMTDIAPEGLESLMRIAGDPNRDQ